MSIENERLKDSWIQQALKKQGKSIRNPFWRFGQLSSSDFQAVIGKLPHREPPEVQVMIPGSDYGKFYFLPDFDDPDDSSVVIL